MIIWIIYFWFIAVLVVLSAFGRAFLYFKSEAVRIYDLIESLISITAIVGLYGFVYQVPILTADFWKVILILITLAWIWSIFSAKNKELIKKFGMAKASMIIALTSVIGIPTLIGLAIYGFRSSGLWEN
jgi:hypothetical protein